MSRFDTQLSTLSRRTMLTFAIGAAAIDTAFAASAPAASGEGKPVPVNAVAVSALQRFMKLHASVAAGRIPWYYTGRIYAALGAKAPVHLFNFEGTEIYWVKRLGADDWRVSSSTLTFYRDRTSGAYLDTFDNPLTGRSIPVRPNVLRDKASFGTHISESGYEISSGNLLPWQLEVQAIGGTVWLTTSRYLAGAPQPWIEIQSMLGPEKEVNDPRVASVKSTFASTYLAPWLAWLGMGETTGHLVWHAAGCKLID
ncbi:MAG: DUF1838 family protein, partial [Pseudomonadales bacterium]|nr:DUF1838 family protein [Pseudomonadales bacterium]